MPSTITHSNTVHFFGLVVRVGRFHDPVSRAIDEFGWSLPQRYAYVAIENSKTECHSHRHMFTFQRKRIDTDLFGL
jgi:hypothetical protein